MLFPALILFLLILLLSAFFSSVQFSPCPVYRRRMDNTEKVTHAKGMASYLIDNKEIKIPALLREPPFFHDSASLEKVHRRNISLLYNLKKRG
jgi:CBS domain containing-hemolysin-like protein